MFCDLDCHASFEGGGMQFGGGGVVIPLSHVWTKCETEIV